MKAVYDVISGDAGQAHDWDRFRTLFHKDARLIPSRKDPQTGIIGARVLGPEDYIKNSGPYLEKNGFHEREISRHVDQYGNIAQVFSTYASYHKHDDKDPFMTQTSNTVGSIRLCASRSLYRAISASVFGWNERYTTCLPSGEKNAPPS